MKKVVSYLLSLLIMVQCFCIVPFNAFANESEKYSTCFTKFLLSDNSTEYVHSIIKDDCLMVDVQWLCDKLGLVYKRLDTSHINQLTKALNEKTNYFLSQNNLKDIFNENIQGFTVSKKTSDFSFIFHEGKSKATASSFYLGKYSVNLGTEVTPVTDKNGNVSYYVPLFVFCNIFNAAYKIYPGPESNCIALYEPDITVVDILHMQNSLSKYETHNCLVDAINDDVLTFLGMALGETIDNAIESALTLKWANGLDPTKDNYELLALQMCSSDTDEILSLTDSGETLNFTKDVYSTFYDEMIKAVQESFTSGSIKSKMDMYNEILKNDNNISLSEFEKYYSKYKSITDINKTAKISDAFNTSVNVSFSMLFNSVALIAEMSSVQDKYVENMNVYLEYANKTFSDDELYGHNYIQKKLDLYKSSSGTTFEKMKNILRDDDMVSNMAVPFAELLSLQLGSLSLTHSVTKWGVNKLSGGAFDYKDIYFNCLCSLKLQNTTEAVMNSYFKDSKFDMNTYRALEWTRLKSYYVANENEIELYKQYYETLKSDADTNPTLILLYQLGFGKKEKYSDAELEEFAKKVGNSVIYDTDSAFEDYNMMIESKKLLDYESEKINYDTKELAEYMAVLLYGTDGTTPENVKNCESFVTEKNKWVLENNYALYQPAECKVVESEEKNPVEGAEVIFKSDKGDSIICTTDDDGNVLGLDETINNSFTDDINGNKNIQGILEENDPEKQDSAFSQYEPNVKLSTVELYLPLGSYSLDIKASGYKDYEHEETIEIKVGEKCELGEILLERDDMAWRVLYREKLTEIMESGVLGSNAEFDLIYVNEDDIPELIVCPAAITRLSTCYLYTIVNGKVVDPGNEDVINSDKWCYYGEYGMFTYLHKQNEYMVTHSTPSYCYYYDVYTLDRTLLHSYVNGFPFNPPESGWATADDVSVTNEEIHNKISQYTEHNLYVDCNFQYKLNETSINSVLSDAPQEIFNTVDEKENSSFITSAELTVYAGPGEYFDEINSIPKDTEIEKCGIRQGAVYGYPVNEELSAKSELRDKWIYILYDGKYGWIKDADDYGIKENTVYHGGWVEGNGPAAPRYTKELILVDNKIEIEETPLMGSPNIYTFEISEISGNTYYLKNGTYRSQTAGDTISEGKINVNDDGSFDISYNFNGRLCEDHFVLE